MKGSPQKWAIVPQGQHWRAQLAARKAAWTERNMDDVHQSIEDDVYQRALNAEKLHHIARMYGVPTTEFDVAYGDIFRLGNAEMQSIIARDTLEHGLTSNIPVSKIWMGKSLGGLGDTTSVSATGEQADDGNVQISVNVIRKPREEV